MLKQLFALAAFASLTFADTVPEYEWVVRAGGPLNDKTYGMCTEAKGNIFITGEFAGAAQWGDFTVTSAGDKDFFVAKLDAAGKFLWVRSGGGSKGDRGYGVACDAEGNCYVAGACEGADCKFDGRVLTAAGGYDAFVGKYDSNGRLEGIQSAGGAGYDYAHGIAISTSGKVYVTGAVVGDAAFGDAKVPNAKNSHVFCACYTQSGLLSWVRTAEGRDGSNGQGVCVDNAGNAYVGGTCGGVSTLGGVALSNPAGSDILVAKFTPAGELAWVQQGFGSPRADIGQVSVDKEGRVFAGGEFKGPLRMEDGKVVESRGDKDLLLTRIDPAGKRLWTITGGGPKTDIALAVVTDGKGGCLLTGEMADTMEILGRTLTSRGLLDIYVASIDASGNLRWLTQAGGPGNDSAYAIAMDAEGNTFFSGTFNASATFGSKTLTSAGGGDVYVAKLKTK